MLTPVLLAALLGPLLAAEDLLPYSGSDATSPVPTTAELITNLLRKHGDVYIFTCHGETETLEYIFDPRIGLLDGLRIRCNGANVANPFRFRAIMAPRAAILSDEERRRLAADETADLREPAKKSFAAPARSRFLDAAADGDVLVANYEFSTPEAGTAKLRAKIKAVGKSLELRLAAEEPLFSSAELTIQGKPIPGEYEIGGSSYRIGDRLFASILLDLWQSDASELRGNGSVYGALTDGSRNPLRDTFYLTVSSSYPETLANSPWPPSPFLEEFQGRVVLDMWEGAYDGTFAGQLKLLRQLKSYFVDHLLIIAHNWQNLGLERSNPDMMPANEAMGGDEGLRKLSVGATELGHRFSIHENYYDISRQYVPKYESYLLKNSDGSFLPRSGGNLLFLKPSRHMELVKDRAAAATEAYKVNATFHDVMPHWKVDYDASSPGAGMLRIAALEQKKYFQAMRDERNGPMITEMLGGVMAGLWDGGCNAFIDNLRNRQLLPIADLLKVHPKQSNHGVGYYERWLPWGFQPGWNSYKMTDRELDRYRAMQTAFGRMGFIGRQLTNFTPHIHAIVREYHLMRAFGAGYINRKIGSLEYQTSGGKWIDAAEAAETGEWQRLRATYEGGQKVWVNYTRGPWNIDGIELPAWGSATRGPRGTAGTELRNGQITDYSEYENIIYADARSHTWTPVPNVPPLTPELGAWRDLGEGAFEMEIVWRPERTLDHDFSGFWMFRDAGSTVSRPVFHSLAQPGPTATSAWKPGETYRDRRRLRISDKDARTGAKNVAKKYDIVVGLTHPTGGALRPELRDRLDQMRVATMEVERQGDRIVGIKIEAADQAPPPGVDPAPYREGLNVEKRMIDFGKVATNGAVVIRHKDGGRELVPVPKGEPVRVGLSGDVKEVLAYHAGHGDPVTLETKNLEGKVFFDVPDDVERVVVKE